MGWGPRVTPLSSAFLGQADTSPRDWGELGGMVVLKEEGDQCSNLPGAPPLPLWACAMGVGIPSKSQGPALVL